MKKTVTFGAPGWSGKLRTHAVKILMTVKRGTLGVKTLQINLSNSGVTVELEGPDEETIDRAREELQRQLEAA